MKKFLLAVVLCFAFLGLRAQTLDPNYIDGHLYFKFVDSYDFQFVVNENTSINPSEMKQYSALFNRYGVTLITRPLYAFNDRGLERIIRLEFSQYQKIDEFIAELEALPEVEYAERVPLPKLLYNDPYSSGSWGSAGPYQWNLTMINAEGAWAAQVASSSIKVAVVDGAVWGAHPDLNISSSNMCSFATGTASVGSSAPPTSVSQTTTCSYNNFYNNNCPSYDWSHGTHCAGMVAAKNNNSVGISSIGGGDGTTGSGLTLMGVRAANNNDQLYYCSNGVAWAVNNGANVVSMSYGGTSSSTSEQRAYQTYYNNGVVLVAAAGNDGDGNNAINYPAGYSSVISVASVDKSGKLSYFSEYGSGRADIAAPGGFYNNGMTNNILSTTYCVNQYNRIMGMSGLSGQYYDGMQGTSMACPTVAGLCGLMLSAYPAMTPAQVKNCLQTTAIALASGSNAIDGNGYINAQAAVNCAKSLAANLRANPSSITIPSGGGSKTVEITAATNITTNWTASLTPNPGNQFSVTPTSGSGSGATTTITITAGANETGAPINGTLTISQGTGSNRQTTTISVVQNDQSDLCVNVNEQFLTDDSLFMMYITTQRLSSNNSNILFGERFPNDRVGTVDSLTFAYAWTTNTATGSVSISLYNDNGSGKPGTALATKSYTMASLRSSGTNYTTTSPTRNLYYIENFGVKFNTPVEVSGNYYVVIDFSGVSESGTYRYNGTNYNEIGCAFADVAGNAATQAEYNNAILFYAGGSTIYTGANLSEDYYDIAVAAHFCESNEPWAVPTPTVINTDPLMGVEDISINANCDWTVSTDCEWITLSTTSGSDAGTVSFVKAENMGDERSCTITISYEGGSSTVTVNQMAHQEGCEYALYSDVEFGWNGDTDVWEQDSIHFYIYGCDRNSTVDSGYYLGNNYYGDKAKANYIPVYGTGNITSVEYLYTNSGTGGSVVFKIWDGSTGTPTTVLASKTVPMSTLNGSNFYTWELDEPLDVTGSVFVGADFSSLSSGTYMGFFSNVIGDSPNNYAWEQTSDNEWAAFTDNWGDVYTFTAAIFPLICYNGSHTHIDLGVEAFEDDTTTTLTALTIGANEVLDPLYIFYNLGIATYTDSTKIFITIDDNDREGHAFPGFGFEAGDAYLLHDTVATMAELTALGYHHGDVANLCYSIRPTNTTYEWQDQDASNNNACVTVTINCPPVTTALTESACGSFTWGLNTYTESGVYGDTLIAANGCDSIVTLTLTINQATSGEETVTNCGTYTWNGNNYSTSGNYNVTGLTNAAGCDSTATLHLTVVAAPVISVTGNTEISAGQTTTLTASGANTYTWKQNGVTVSTSNPFTTPALTQTTNYVVEGNNGTCTGSADVTVTVTAAAATYGDTNAAACGEYTWARTGDTYSASGNYSYTLQGGNALGGDSIITLHLTINALPNVTITGPASVYTGQTATLTASGASTYTWINGGNTVSSSNPYTTPALNSTTTYTVRGTDSHGCVGEASHMISVNVAPTTYGDTSAVECGQFTWWRTGMTYSSSGEIQAHTTNYLGGDSVITLHLTINPNPTIVIEGTTTITSGNSTTLTATGATSYVWTLNGSTESTSATYTAAPATSTTYNVSGTDANGCSNSTTVTVVVTAPSTVFDTVVRTACGSYIWNGNTYTNSGFYQYAEGNNVHVLNLTINPLPEITVSGNTSIYIGQTTTLTASGATTYTWATGGNTVSTSNPYTTSALNATTTYTVTGVDANGCEGTGSVTVQVSQASATYNEIYVTECGSYTWDLSGGTYRTSGTFTQPVGQNVNGGDSIARLHLTINPSPVVTVTGNTNITAGQSTTLTASGADTYSWSANGNVVSTNNPFTVTPTGTTTYTVTGTYTATGCTGTYNVTVYTTAAGATYGEVSATACDAYQWQLNGRTYTSSGDYQYTIAGGNAMGGDSVVTLHLTINTTTYATSTATACDTYTWTNGSGATYTTSGEYQFSSTGTNGCPLITTLNLTINNSTTTTVSETVCDSYTWTNGTGATYTTTGNYQYQQMGTNGCLATTVLNLTVNHSTSSVISEEACDSYEWHGYTYAETGSYEWTSTNAAGCDDVTTLNLTIHNSTEATETAEACDSYQWDRNGQTYTQSTDNATYTTTNQFGCAHVITLHLTIKNSVSTSITDTVVAGEAYTANGFDVTAAETGNNAGRTLNKQMTFTAANGCDSVVNLRLVVIDGQGIDNVSGINFAIYPNPAATNVEIDCESISAVKVYDVAGRVVEEQKGVNADKTMVDVSKFAEGTYVFSITTQNGVTVKQKVVVTH